MNSGFDPTETELGVLDSARRLLGSNLAKYLLSGLGETQVTHRRAYAAWSTSRRSENVAYGFEMINDSGQGLPHGRDPLVLAALLDLLWDQRPLDGTIRFHESVLMEGLGWPQSGESKSRIKTALERYLLTAFYLIDPTVTEEERVFGRYSHFGRLLVGYEPTLIGTALYGIGGRGQIQLMFLPEFIECVMSEGKKFLGVEFQRLRGMSEISS
jgi:hypothetical protein